LKIKTNKVFHSLQTTSKKIVAHQGGTRSGKTYNILLWIIFDYCNINTGKTVTICRNTFPALRATVMRDFFEILKKHDIYLEQDHNKTNSEYKLFGNLVEFISLDQPQKVRGRKRDMLFCNEANELTYEQWNQLVFRTLDKIVLDFNPSDEFHFIYDKILTREDCDFYITTYKDNPFLDRTLVEEIERLKETDEQYWQIYGLGLRGISKATIFSFTEGKRPDDAQLVGYGMDLGFSVDPSTLVEVYQKDYTLYCRELLYRTMMTTADLHNFLKTQNLQEYVYIDSAEPRLIEELRRMGNKVRPTLKGQDSIRAGIDLLKRYKLVIDPQSDNLIREMRNYKWQEDRTGKLLNKPVAANDHTIDSLRYATYNVLSRPNYGKYAIR
jgi:phage terminase large subunit